jgi:hypothetical protein
MVEQLGPVPLVHQGVRERVDHGEPVGVADHPHAVRVAPGLGLFAAHRRLGVRWLGLGSVDHPCQVAGATLVRAGGQHVIQAGGALGHHPAEQHLGSALLGQRGREVHAGHVHGQVVGGVRVEQHHDHAVLRHREVSQRGALVQPGAAPGDAVDAHPGGRVARGGQTLLGALHDDDAFGVRQVAHRPERLGRAGAEHVLAWPAGGPVLGRVVRADLPLHPPLGRGPRESDGWDVGVRLPVLGHPRGHVLTRDQRLDAEGSSKV